MSPYLLFCLITFHLLLFIKYYRESVSCITLGIKDHIGNCHSLVDRDNIGHCLNMPKLSRFDCCNSRIISGHNQRKPLFLWKRKPSLMKTDGVLYNWYTDCQDGLMLDCFATRYAEVKLKWMAKIAHGEVYPCLFIVSS